jgi:hypothetical protein
MPFPSFIFAFLQKRSSIFSLNNNEISNGMEDAFISITEQRRTGQMKTQTAKKGLYLGATAGLILFIVIGLLPSSFVGGVLGLKIASYVLGTAVESALISRAVVGIAMVTGVLVTGLVFVVGTSLIGWAIANINLAARLRRLQGSV